MATVQLIGVRPRVATVQRDGEAPVEMTWGLLHEAQEQDGDAGLVYRWLMREFCRCSYSQRQGRPWHSPRREVGEIVADMRAREAREAREDREASEAARREREERQAAEDMRRRRDEEARRVEAERRATAANSPWWPIPSWEVPLGVRFDVLPRDRGQIVEVSYGTFGRAEAGRCDPYMAVTDHSDGSCRVYKRRG